MQMQVERKTFTFLLKENPRGRFPRIIEENGRHSDSIIIPSAGLEAFQKLLDEMAKAAAELPPKDLVQQAACEGENPVCQGTAVFGKLRRVFLPASPRQQLRRRGRRNACHAGLLQLPPNRSVESQLGSPCSVGCFAESRAACTETSIRSTVAPAKRLHAASHNQRLRRAF